MTCASCGATMDSTATTCSVCGAALAGAGPAGSADPAAAAGPSYGAGPTAGDAWSPPPGAQGTSWSGPAPHPSGLASDVRNWGLAAHLSAFAGAWVALAFLGPLVVWMIKRDDHPFIDHHAREALNFNLSFLLYGVVGTIIAVPLALLTLGIGLIPLVLAGIALVIVWVLFPILAAVKAANGEGYRYPLTIRFIR